MYIIEEKEVMNLKGVDSGIWEGLKGEKNESINIFQVPERLRGQKELEGAKRRDKHGGLKYKILRK